MAQKIGAPFQFQKVMKGIDAVYVHSQKYSDPLSV